MGTRCWFINWKFTSSHSIQVFWLHSKNQNQKRKTKMVNNHYVVTQTSSALQITQQKCFSWAPVKVWTRRPWCARKGSPLASLILAAKECFISYPIAKKWYHLRLRRFGLWETSLPGNFLLATLLEMMKYHCLSSLFLTFGTMSHFCTTGKDQMFNPWRIDSGF